MEKLFNLIDLQHKAFEAEDPKALTHVICNETIQCIPYQSLTVWYYTDNDVHLKHVSGNMTLDQNSPYSLSLKAFIKKQIKQKDQKEETTLTFDKLDFTKQNATLVTFKNNDHKILGGAWLEHDQTYTEADFKILEEAAFIYSHALEKILLKDKEKRSVTAILKSFFKKPVLFIIIALLFLPVNLSVSAPAEIIAAKPSIISAPYNGILETIDIAPGDSVKLNQTVALMEQLDLESQLTTVAKDLEITRNMLSRLRRQALLDPDKKTELRRIEAQIKTKEIERDFAQKKLNRSVLKAPKAGIAIFSDKQALEGKPVQTGQPIMSIADPNNAALLIRIPVDTMIPLQKDKPVDFFLNKQPLSSEKANITAIGYQASADADKLFTYKVYAELDNKALRIGSKGTAKVYGGRTILLYAILRRPLAMLREFLGL